MGFTILKYKPEIRFFKKKSWYNESTIYGLMSSRNYSVFREMDIEGLKITNYKKYVEKFLTECFEGKEKDKDDRGIYPTDYIYVWYVRYPQRLLDIKTLIIFRKEFIISKIPNNTVYGN